MLAVAGALADGEGLLEMGLSLGELVFEDQELGGTAVTLGHGEVRLAYRLLPHSRAALDVPPGDTVETAQHRGVGADVERLGVVHLLLAVHLLVDGQGDPGRPLRLAVAAEDEADAAEVREGRGTIEAVARFRLLEDLQSLAEQSLGLGVLTHRLVDDAERAERGRHARVAGAEDLGRLERHEQQRLGAAVLRVEVGLDRRVDGCVPGHFVPAERGRVQGRIHEESPRERPRAARARRNLRR